jgi:hypothetical protein
VSGRPERASERASERGSESRSGSRAVLHGADLKAGPSYYAGRSDEPEATAYLIAVEAHQIVFRVGAHHRLGRGDAEWAAILFQ